MRFWDGLRGLKTWIPPNQVHIETWKTGIQNMPGFEFAETLDGIELQLESTL